MAIINPTSPTFSQIEAPVVLASGTNGNLRTLDLKTKYGAWLYVRIGRRNGSALTRSGYVMVRRTDNDTLVHPAVVYDIMNSIAAAQNNTFSAGTSIGDTTLTLTSAAGFAIGDTICMHSDDTAANRVEFNRIVDIATNTLTLERAMRVAHNNLDRVTSLAEVASIFLPGGDHYDIRCINVSGQPLLFAVDAAVLDSETIT